MTGRKIEVWKRLKSERGSTLVEFALALVLFLTILFAIIDFGRAVWIYGTLAHAAREGTRYAIVRGAESPSPADTANIRTYVQRRSGFGSRTLVTTKWCRGATCENLPTNYNKFGDVVQVTAKYSFQPTVFVFSRVGAITMGTTSRMVISF